MIRFGKRVNGKTAGAPLRLFVTNINLMANLTVPQPVNSTNKLRGNRIKLQRLFRHWIGFSVPHVAHQSLISDMVSLSAIPQIQAAWFRSNK